MVRIKTQKSLICLLGVLTLVGCQQPGNISTDAGSTLVSRSAASDIPQDPITPIVSPPVVAPPSTPVVNPPVATPGTGVVAASDSCAGFLAALPTSNSVSVKDLMISGNSRDVLVADARNVRITGNSGNVRVDLSTSADGVTGNCGDVYLNSGVVKEISGNSSHELCISAKSIARVVGNSAHMTIVADSIDMLTGGSGENRITAQKIGQVIGNSHTLHFYKAVVGRMTGQSGLVCLHDGATITTRDGSSAAVRSDCP